MPRQADPYDQLVNPGNEKHLKAFKILRGNNQVLKTDFC